MTCTFTNKKCPCFVILYDMYLKTCIKPYTERTVKRDAGYQEKTL